MDKTLMEYSQSDNITSLSASTQETFESWTKLWYWLGALIGLLVLSLLPSSVVTPLLNQRNYKRIKRITQEQLLRVNVNQENDVELGNYTERGVREST